MAQKKISSLFGIATLIIWFTSKFLDIHVKSKFCKSREFWEKKVDSIEYEEWAENHANECQINYTGSAGKVEVDAVI